MNADKQLRLDVVDELDFDPSVDSAHIGVSVDGGAVRLTGHVGSYSEKLAAIKAVKKVRGVRAVADDIEVRFASDKKTSDDEIAKRAISILKWDTLLPRDSIQVIVNGGYVTLSGEVKWWYQRKSAEQDIRKLSGVLGVINNIKIKPTVTAINVKEKIENALKRRIETEIKDIRVTVHGDNKVTLEGKVHDWDEKWAAWTAALSTPGVKDVEDRLKIA